MSGRLTKIGYKRLIEGDIEWLLKQPRTLERDHIILVLKQSIDSEYPERFCPNGHKMGAFDANCDYNCIHQ